MNKKKRLNIYEKLIEAFLPLLKTHHLDIHDRLDELEHKLDIILEKLNDPTV